MKSARHGMPIARAAVACAVAFVGVVAIVALAVAAAGASDDARRALRFGFAGVERSPSAVVGVALNNARFAAGALVCAGAFPRLGARARTLVDGLLAALLVLNAVAVGVAIVRTAHAWSPRRRHTCPSSSARFRSRRAHMCTHVRTR